MKLLGVVRIEVQGFAREARIVDRQWWEKEIDLAAGADVELPNICRHFSWLYTITLHYPPGTGNVRRLKSKGYVPVPLHELRPADKITIKIPPAQITHTQ
jgi:hypothetical protein